MESDKKVEKGAVEFLAEVCPGVSLELIQLILNECKGNTDDASFRLLVRMKHLNILSCDLVLTSLPSAIST